MAKPIKRENEKEKEKKAKRTGELRVHYSCTAPHLCAFFYLPITSCLVTTPRLRSSFS